MSKYLLALLCLIAISLPAQAQAAHQNTLTWGASSTPGALYNIYKDHGCTGVFVKLTATPLAALTYADIGMADGECNAYYVTALGAAGSNIGESTQSESTIMKIVTPSLLSLGNPLAAPPTKPAFKTE
jgi:hypothetical protein